MIFEYGIGFLILGLILLISFKSVFLKFILLIYWYPLITMYLFCVGFPLGGSLDVIGRPVHEPYCVTAFEYAVLGFYVLLVVLWKIRDEKLEFERLLFSESFRIFIVGLLLVVSVLAYPRAMGLGSQRWNLIAGPWLVVSISLNAILLVSLKTIKSVSAVVQMVLSLILIIGGERANTLVVFFLFFMLYSDENKDVVEERKMSVFLIFFLSIGVLLAITAHYWRAGEEVNQLVFYSNIISSSTVGDVVHIYFTSFGYLAEKGIDLRPILNEVGSLLYIPGLGGAGVKVKYNFTEILRDYLYNYGGGIFYTEGVLIFGKLGVLVYSFVYGLMIRFLFKYSRSTWWVTIMMMIFIMLQMRIQWYGFIYIYTPIMFAIIATRLLNLIRLRGNEFELVEENN